MKNERMIDETDHQILEILQDKARVPNAEVARQVGMAPSAVLERIRKLEERGFIEGYEVRLNPVEFGQGLTAFVQVRAQATANGKLAVQLCEVTGVQEVHQVAGEDGYLLKLRVADNAELGAVLRDELSLLKGVESTRTSIVLNTFKETRKIDLHR
jgi:Lrp/AsnC family leucine-responsive transcriptional regulator